MGRKRLVPGKECWTACHEYHMYLGPSVWRHCQYLRYSTVLNSTVLVPPTSRYYSVPRYQYIPGIFFRYTVLWDHRTWWCKEYFWMCSAIKATLNYCIVEVSSPKLATTKAYQNNGAYRGQNFEHRPTLLETVAGIKFHSTQRQRLKSVGGRDAWGSIQQLLLVRSELGSFCSFCLFIVW